MIFEHEQLPEPPVRVRVMYGSIAVFDSSLRSPPAESDPDIHQVPIEPPEWGDGPKPESPPAPSFQPERAGAYMHDELTIEDKNAIDEELDRFSGFWEDWMNQNYQAAMASQPPGQGVVIPKPWPKKSPHHQPAASPAVFIRAYHCACGFAMQAAGSEDRMLCACGTSVQWIKGVPVGLDRGNVGPPTLKDLAAAVMRALPGVWSVDLRQTAPGEVSVETTPVGKDIEVRDWLNSIPAHTGGRLFVIGGQSKQAGGQIPWSQNLAPAPDSIADPAVLPAHTAHKPPTLDYPNHPGFRNVERHATLGVVLVENRIGERKWLNNLELATKPVDEVFYDADPTWRPV